VPACTDEENGPHGRPILLRPDGRPQQLDRPVGVDR
jgi:hypothetical protein